MKKTTLTIWFVAIFALFVAYERMNSAPAAVVALSSSNNQNTGVTSAAGSPPTSSSAPAAGGGTPPTSGKTATKSPAAPSTQKPVGQYRDGTYTGQSVNAYYGNVKVQAVVSGGKLANVVFLNYPQSHSASVYINSQAMPYLTQEALQMQSANVDMISGATFTSEAFVQSLASALAQAKNS